MMEGVLDQKKEVWSKYSAKIRRYRDKNMSPTSQKFGTVVPPSRVSFAAFSSGPSYSIVVLLNSPYSCLDFKSIVSYK
jgi:hypothetical protein